MASPQHYPTDETEFTSRKSRADTRALFPNFRRRRKTPRADLLETFTFSPFQRLSVLAIFVISWVEAFSFLPIPRLHSLPPAKKLAFHRSPSLSSRFGLIHGQRTHSANFASNYEDDSESPDEDEWRAMLAAFKMYKAAYGNLKVPLRFVVPSLAPWPARAWGLKLGHRVAAIRSTGKFVSNEKRRKILDDMGFEWRLRAASMKEKDDKGISFDQIYSAMVTYLRVVQNGEGPVSIPNSFVVPDCDPWPENVRGLPLGRKLASLRSKSFLAANPGAKEKLRAVGFELDGKAAANDARFQLVYDALQRYKDIYGDLVVPQPFVVPEKSKEWPEQTWGLRLGARVNAIRSQGTFINSNPERKELLDDLGFVWNPAKSELGTRRGRRKKEDVETAEATPKSAEAKFGGRGDVSESADSEFDALLEDSFLFDEDNFGDGSGSESPKWGLEGKGLEEAARLAEEEAKAAREYKPPRSLSESLAEAKRRAIEVGIIEDRPEEKRNVKAKREKNIPWFNDDFGGEFVFDDVVEALTVYKSIYGNFSNLTNETFVVPTQSENYLEIGKSADSSRMDDARSRAAAAIANFEDRRRDFSNDLDSFFAELSEPEMENSEVATRRRELTSDDSHEWPEHLGGMALGNIVRRIRDGSLEVKHLPDRKAKLDELGFDWGDPKYFIDIAFEKAMCSMFAYYLVRGDLLVPREFVMPDDDPWPQALAGYKVGEAVHRIRELQNFFETYHPDKVSLLRTIDFAWFPTMALPLDPNEPEMSPEMIMLNGLGHPLFRFREVPFGLMEKILEDGPFFETDDPRLWWRKYYNFDYVKDEWYESGVRDLPMYLRQRGYLQMAAEHEEKYGPGLLTQMYETLDDVQKGFDGRSEDELAELLEKLQYFYQEMTGCTQILKDQKKKLLADLDDYIFALTDGREVEFAREDSDLEYENEEVDEQSSDYFEEEEDDEDDQKGMSEEDEEEEGEEFEDEFESIDEEFDLDDELGLESNERAKR